MLHIARLPRVLGIAALFFSVLAISSIGMSDVAFGQTGSGSSSDSSSAPNNASEIKTVELDEAEATPKVMERVDWVFGKMVKFLADWLFFGVGSHEQQYIQFDHEEYYVRDRGSSGPFQRLNAGGTDQPESISELEAKALLARGELVPGLDENSAERPFRLGKVDDKLVEYLTIVIDKSSKYIRVEGDPVVFRKQTAMRGLLSEEADDALSESEAEQLHKQGRLLTTPTKTGTTYILSSKVGGMPVVVLWLAFGSVVFTLYMRGVNVWAFRHAIEIVRGKFDNPKEPGEVTHFQALSSALSATVGLGNIAGVTVAMTMGGPGAFFWMLACGVFGMTSKFVECTLGQKYRQVRPDGTILGGPMQYLDVGLREIGLGPLGKVLAVVFAVMCIMASFGGGNMFQANQSGSAMLKLVQTSDLNTLEKLNDQVKEAAEKSDFEQLAALQTERNTVQAKMDRTKSIFLPVFGIIFALSVGMVIIGGIKRIAAAAEKIVPTMCLLYIAACLWIIAGHIVDVPGLVATIFQEAFSGQALAGGFVGVLVIGVQRAAFSNEAGVGSAAIAHSAAKTEEPVREGAVALLGPFIDTIVVCSMTALVILITGAWNNESWIVGQGLSGSALTSRAFEAEISWFPYVLSVAILLFAYSTIISWSYYGEKCWERLFGRRSTIIYKAIYVFAVFVGAIVNLGAVLDFSDMMILSMAFPNILGLLLLSPKVRRDLLDYWSRYKAGKFKTFK